MNILRQSVLILLLLTFASVGLSAQEIRYVTDRLSLGLFEKEKASGRRLATLDSGTVLEVLSGKGSYAKVRTAEGDVGWVKSAYLISEKPAVVKLSELESLYQKKALQLDECKATETEPPEKTIQRLKTLEKQLDNKDSELKNAKLRIERLVTRIHTQTYSGKDDENVMIMGPFLWYAFGAVVLFIIGIFFGAHLITSRLRKRFYGFTLS